MSFTDSGKTFPGIQFIISTHSPQVLGEINSDYQVFSLQKKADEIVCGGLQNYFGLDSNSILEEALRTDSVNGDIKRKVGRMYDSIEQRDFEQAEKYIADIDGLTQNRNADTARYYLPSYL